MHRHHILPKYRGGSNDPTNIIEVSIRQHAMWHFCNWRLWKDERDYCAWRGLTGAMSKRQIFGHLATTKKERLIVTKAAILEVDCNETMRCVKCDSVSNLVGSESLGYTVRRIRVCPKCGHKFLTYEIPQILVGEAEEFVKSGYTR